MNQSSPVGAVPGRSSADKPSVDRYGFIYRHALFGLDPATIPFIAPGPLSPGKEVFARG
jgi:hypothetical protein